MEKCYKRCHQYKSCQECLGSSGGAEAGKYIQIDFQKCFRVWIEKKSRPESWPEPGKKSILAGQCTVCFKDKNQHFKKKFGWRVPKGEEKISKKRWF